MTLRGDHLYVASERDDLIGRFTLGRPGCGLHGEEKVVPFPSPVTIAFA